MPREELDKIGQCVIDPSPDWVLSYTANPGWRGDAGSYKEGNTAST